jgi:hypothetical protein
MNAHAKPPRGPDFARWLIRPAQGWRHKARGMVKNRMFLLLGVIGAAFAAGLGINLWLLISGSTPAWLTVAQSVFLGLGLLVTLSLPLFIYHHLITPLFHLRHWASGPGAATWRRASRCPASGEFAELAEGRELPHRAAAAPDPGDARRGRAPRPNAWSRSPTPWKCSTTWRPASTCPGTWRTCSPAFSPAQAHPGRQRGHGPAGDPRRADEAGGQSGIQSGRSPLPPGPSPRPVPVRRGGRW